MDLLDRYLKAVGRALPTAQREDIIRELSEDIRSEMEEKENELARALTEAEQEVILRQRGNPLLLAARYRQDQRALAFGRQLIGPVLFPFYIKVLSFNLSLTFGVIATIFMSLAASGHAIRFNDIVSTVMLQLFIQMGAVTLIFSLVQSHLTKHPDRWDLNAKGGGLRCDLTAEKNISVRVPVGTPRVSRFESVSIIIACTVALLWLTEVKSYPFLVLGPAAAFLKLAPIWYQVYFPIVLLTVAEIVRAIINLIRPDWTLFRAVFNVVSHSLGLVVVYFLIRAGSWVVAGGPAEHASEYAHAVEIVNQCFYYSLFAAAVLSAVMLVIRIARIIRQIGSRGGSASVGAPAKEGN